jgi:hypothetical protein
VLRAVSWLNTAWSLTNLYVGSTHSKCLNAKRSYLVGLSHETVCYVSTDSFNEDDALADFLVHDAVHFFRN